MSTLRVVFIATCAFVTAAALHELRSTYQQLAPESYDPNLPVRVLNIDEQSLAKIGQWPWPRTTVGNLVKALAARGAASIAFDVLFAEPDRTSLDEIAKHLHLTRERVRQIEVRAMAKLRTSDLQTEVDHHDVA